MVWVSTSASLFYSPIFHPANRQEAGMQVAPGYCKGWSHDLLAALTPNVRGNGCGGGRCDGPFMAVLKLNRPERFNHHSLWDGTERNKHLWLLGGVSLEEESRAKTWAVPMKSLKSLRKAQNGKGKSCHPFTTLALLPCFYFFNFPLQ